MSYINTVTKRELIEMLEQYDDDQLIAVSVKSGDYWHTQLAIGIDDIELETVEYSGYHNQFKLTEKPVTDEEETGVLLITLNY